MNRIQLSVLVTGVGLVSACGTTPPALIPGTTATATTDAVSCRHGYRLVVDSGRIGVGTRNGFLAPAGSRRRDRFYTFIRPTRRRARHRVRAVGSRALTSVRDGGRPPDRHYRRGRRHGRGDGLARHSRTRRTAFVRVRLRRQLEAPVHRRTRPDRPAGRAWNPTAHTAALPRVGRPARSARASVGWRRRRRRSSARSRRADLPPDFR